MPKGVYKRTKSPWNKGLRMPPEWGERVSLSLRGKIGEEARQWKGADAGYAAIHMWIKKYWGAPDHCDICGCKVATRFEWCNIDKQYRRGREDWFQACTSCHRRYDHAAIQERLYGDKCLNGHLISDNLEHNNRGHRICKACQRERQRRFNAKVN